MTATAATRTFNNPKYNGNALDWCVNWGKGCGRQAANAYCKAKGFEKATNFSKASNIGSRRPTRLIGTGAVCDQDHCDGFRRITCFKETTVTYRNPKWQGNRLDWCLNWGQKCGKPAANAYCRKRGHERTIGFKKASNIGDRQPTRLITTGAVCDDGHCDGFRFIRCR
ncbi:MAG: hypothetical protein ACLFU3_05085 [Dichotomicrobium sp.]